MSTARKPPSPAQPPEPSAVCVVPRAWLIALPALIVVPWLFAGAFYFWPSAGSPVRAADTPISATAGGAGPWGKIDLSPIVISPPIEYLGDDWTRGPDAGKQWKFPGTKADEVPAFLSAVGFSGDQVSRLMASARGEPAINGVVITPDEELVRGMSAEVRARLYVQLAKTPLNQDQAGAFRYAGDSADDWLGRSPLSPATRKIVFPLIYRYGQHVYFADQAIALSQIRDREERRRLAKALLRQTTLRVRLSVPELSDVPRLADYWGRGGRRTDVAPLLESIVEAGGDRTLDIIHLLPTLAREHLYRYPRVSPEDMDRPYLANCLWTALNFFNTTPDDRYLDVNFAIERLKQDYYIVQNGFELGDIIAMVDEDKSIFHVVVYLADNLVFTKNGKSPLSPWVILPLDVVKDYYRSNCEDPQLVYHRRKDF